MECDFRQAALTTLSSHKIQGCTPSPTTRASSCHRYHRHDYHRGPGIDSNHVYDEEPSTSAVPVSSPFDGSRILKYFQKTSSDPLTLTLAPAIIIRSVG